MKKNGKERFSFILFFIISYFISRCNFYKIQVGCGSFRPNRMGGKIPPPKSILSRKGRNRLGFLTKSRRLNQVVIDTNKPLGESWPKRRS